jgi:hypothetical protein
MPSLKNILLLCSLFFSVSLYGQGIKLDSSFAKLDSLGNSKMLDSSNNTHTLSKNTNLALLFNVKNPIPKRAAMYSALLPGLGQAYNKQYWKIPIVYGGLLSAGYIINQQYKNYIKYRKAFIYVTDGNPNTTDTTYSSTQLFQLQKQSRSNLDKLGVYTTVFYALNIVDALVSSHLRNFDMSKSISLQCKPVVSYQNIGFAVCVSYRYN